MYAFSRNAEKWRRLIAGAAPVNNDQPGPPANIDFSLFPALQLKQLKQRAGRCYRALVARTSTASHGDPGRIQDRVRAILDHPCLMDFERKIQLGEWLRLNRPDGSRAAVASLVRPLFERPPVTAGDCLFMGDLYRLEGEPLTAKSFYLRGLKEKSELSRLKLYLTLLHECDRHLHEHEKEALMQGFKEYLKLVPCRHLVTVLEPGGLELTAKYGGLDSGRFFSTCLEELEIQRGPGKYRWGFLFYYLFSHYSGFSGEQRRECVRQAYRYLSGKKKKTSADVYRLASLADRLNRRKRAVVLFKKIIDDSDNVDLLGGAHFHLGRIYYRMGQLKQSGTQLRQCLRYMPHHREAKRLLHSI
jgi:hypothetical protein